jgi:hypothetical protein
MRFGTTSRFDTKEDFCFLDLPNPARCRPQKRWGGNINQSQRPIQVPRYLRESPWGLEVLCGCNRFWPPPVFPPASFCWLAASPAFRTSSARGSSPASQDWRFSSGPPSLLRGTASSYIDQQPFRDQRNFRCDKFVFHCWENGPGCLLTISSRVGPKFVRPRNLGRGHPPTKLSALSSHNFCVSVCRLVLHNSSSSSSLLHPSCVCVCACGLLWLLSLSRKQHTIFMQFANRQGYLVEERC